MEEEKVENITLKKSTLWKLGAVVFGILFVLSLFTGGFRGSGGSGSGTGTVPAEKVAAPTGNVKVSVDKTDPVLGDANAEVSIIEFSDFQCPFCARAHTGAMTEFKNSKYFKNGEVNLVYKHFPLSSIHPNAQKAAEASVCAQNQGKFWEYHDMLFEKGTNALDVVSLKSYAVSLGLDTGKFNNCLDSGDASGKVSNDMKQATDAGGRGTPYFVLINNDGETQVVSGAQPWPNFEAAIQSLL